jgi:hypothetical protein
LDAINETNWSLADFLYFTFRVKDEKTNDGVVHRTKQHASAVGRFMRGQDKYVISDILQCWFRSPDGRLRTLSEHEQMYSTSTPYSGIRAARPAITLFAAQIVKIKLLKERQEAVKPSGGLHANTNMKATDKAITWEDIGLTTVADVTKTIKSIQPLTYDYLLELSTPKVHRHNGVLVQRTRRPPELVINCSYSNCRDNFADKHKLQVTTYAISSINFSHTAMASRLPKIQAILNFASGASNNMFSCYSRIGNSTAYSTVYRDLTNLSSAEAKLTEEVGRDPAKWSMLRFDNVQSYSKRRDLRIG